MLFGLLWIGVANDAIVQNLPVIPDMAAAVERSTDPSSTISADPTPTAEPVVSIVTLEEKGNFTARD
ncbi:MAG: hypothetical protein OXH57_11260 [Ekhidna sp.]|nr:hypothetical protein [Ekhidna sp.]